MDESRETSEWETIRYKIGDSSPEESKPAKKQKPETRGRKKGQRSGKSLKTIQRYNWIREMRDKFRDQRLGHTNNEFAGLILSVLKENPPRFFENHRYKKSTILKVLKNKSWGND